MDGILPDSLDDTVRKATGKTDPANPADAIAQISAIRKNEAAETAPVLKQIQEDEKTDKAKTDTAASNLSGMEKIEPWKAQPKDTDPIKAFGSLGSVFGILASAFTHQPWANAMNASAAAVNAVKAGDRQAYDDAYSAYKTNVTAMLDRQKQMDDEYTKAMDLRKTNLAEGNAALELIHAKYGDQAGQVLANQGMWEKYGELQQKRSETGVKIKDLQADIDQKHREASAYFDLQGAVKSKDPEKIKDATLMYQAASNRLSGGAGGTGAASIADADADRIAEQYLAGDKSGLTGLGQGNVGGANRAKVQDSISRIAKERGMKGADIAAKIAEFSGLTASERAVGTRTAGMEIAANEVKYMAPLALQASKNVDRTEYPKFNEILLSAEKGTGDTDVVRFGLAANSLIYTYAKFLNPTGVPTDADKAKATEILSTAWSKGQFDTAVDQIQKEIKSGESGAKKTKEGLSDTLTGKHGEDQEASTLPPGIPDGSKQVGTYQGHAVYETPDGKKLVDHGGN